MGPVPAKQAAAELGVTWKTVIEWRRYGCPCIPLGASEYLFDVDKLRQWVELNGFGRAGGGNPTKEDRLRARQAGMASMGYLTSPKASELAKHPRTGSEEIEVDQALPPTKSSSLVVLGSESLLNHRHGNMVESNERHERRKAALSLPELIDTQTPSEMPGGLSVADLEAIEVQTRQARLYKEQLHASKLQHQLDVVRGEVVGKDEVRTERLQRIAAVKAKLLSLPGKLGPRLANRSAREIEQELSIELRDVLLEFSRGEEIKEIKESA